MASAFRDSCVGSEDVVFRRDELHITGPCTCTGGPHIYYARYCHVKYVYLNLMVNVIYSVFYTGHHTPALIGIGCSKMLRRTLSMELYVENSLVFKLGVRSATLVIRNLRAFILPMRCVYLGISRYPFLFPGALDPYLCTSPIRPFINPAGWV